MQAAEAIAVIASAEQEPVEAAMHSGPALAEAIAVATATPAVMQAVPEDQQQIVAASASMLNTDSGTGQTDAIATDPLAMVQCTAVTESVQSSTVLTDETGVIAEQTTASVARSAVVTAVDTHGNTVAAARFEDAAATSLTVMEEGASHSYTATSGAAVAAVHGNNVQSVAAMQGIMQRLEVDDGPAIATAATSSQEFDMQSSVSSSSSSRSTAETSNDDTSVSSALQNVPLPISHKNVSDSVEVPESICNAALESMHAALSKAHANADTV